MTFQNLALLFATMFVISAVPGPSDAAVAARASAYGAWHAAAMIIGILLADAVFIVVALVGLGTIARAMSEWFVIVTSLCAAYLIYLGWSTLSALPSESKATTLGSGSIAASLVGGMTVTFADPKAIFFYMGLLPAFIDMHSASWWHGALVMLVATVVIGIVKGAYAWLAIALRERFHRSRQSTGLWLQRLAGGVLIVAGIFLILDALLF